MQLSNNKAACFFKLGLYKKTTKKTKIAYDDPIYLMRTYLHMNLHLVHSVFT